MFRLHRNRQEKSGEKFDFKFSNFKALQVPKGWDKLFVSVVSEQTGKTIVRSGKSSVRNGSCQWTESLSESIWVSQDEISKELEDCNFKIVVAMGSARSNVLGEAMVNMTNYTDSKSSSAISLPLKKCNHGTVLQVKIQCLTPLTKVRSGEFKQTNSIKEDLEKEGHESDCSSDITDSQFSRSIGSSSGADLYSSLHSGEASSKSFSASYSQLSNDSCEVYESVENDAAKNNYSEIQKRDSMSSQNSAPCLSPNSVITGSAEATTIEELRGEARMWERTAHKLMADLDQLKKEFSDQSQNQESLNTALSAATAECDGMRKELEQMKLLTEKSTQRQATMEDLSYHDGEPHILNELKDELMFQKEAIADLTLQLKRSQESNIDLVSVLQELEATNEEQKLEIEELLAQHRKDDDIENIIQENKKLMLQLEHVKESEKNLQLKVELLERNLEETELDLQKSKVSNKRFPRDTDREYDSKLHSEEDINLVKEIEMLKEKVQELEKDCNELTDENMDLLYKLKQANNDSKGEGLAFTSTGGDLLSNSFVNFGFDSIKHKHSTEDLEEKLEESPNVIENNDGSHNKKLVTKKFELEDKVEELESSILSKEDEIKILGDLHIKLQARYSDLQKEKNQIEEQMGAILRESDISSECLNDLRNEVKVLTSSVDLHVSANKILETKYSDLECEKRVLELELENSKSHAVSLQDEVDRLRLEIETGSVDLKQMLNDLQNQCAEAEDQCEYLQRENLKLEAAAKNDLNIMQMESHEKLTALISELSLSKQNQETLRADHEKLLKQLENFKSLEVKLKNSVNDLELKLSVSENERKQHEEELTNLKVQLQETGHYQDELFASRNELELKTGVMKEASFTGNEDLRNELCQIKRVNSTYHQDDSGCDIHDEAESVSRVQLLEKELAEALESNKNYEDQLRRLVSDNQNNKENSPISTVEGGAVGKKRNVSINSALEAELIDIRERYFHISLKYAEVEHQREELVMKLRAAKNGGRGWFS